MKRKRLLSSVLSLLGFGFGAVIGVWIAFEGADRGAPKVAKTWTGMVVVYPVYLLNEVVGPIPSEWLFCIAVGIAALVPGMLGLMVMRLLLSAANRLASKNHTLRKYRNVCMFLAMQFVVCASPAFAQCDPPLPPPPPPGGGVVLYSLNGQTVEANDLGDFFIPNVAVPDVQAPFNVGDDYLRIIGVLPTTQGTQYGCPADDWTLYLYTQSAFQMTADPQTGRFKYVLEPNHVEIRCDPPPLPESITVTALGSPVIEQGGSVVLQTTATLGDGTTQDVTLRTAWTTYRISSSRVAVVCEADLDPMQNPPECQSVSLPSGTVSVVGLAPGTAFITATNGGATSVKQISVIELGGGVSATVEGFVIRPDGSLVNGAEISLRTDTGLVFGGMTQSGPNGNPSWPDGFFSVPVTLPDTVETIIAEATLQSESQTDYGASPSITVIPGGITDAGFIVIELFCDTPWSTAFGAPTLEGGNVLALTVFDDDGNGPKAPRLIAGGKFDKAGGVKAKRIAAWDGQKWSPLGLGVTPGSNGELGDIFDLAVLDLNDGNGINLYAAGYFVSIGGIGANKIARWDGNNWSAVSVGVGDGHAKAYSIAAFDDGSGNGMELYVGGAFCTAGPCGPGDTCPPPQGCLAAQSIAKWNPTTQTWSPVGGGFTDSLVKSVLALAVYNGELYAGGDFTQVEGQSISYIAKWNGTNWSAVGSGLPGVVNALLVFDDGSGPALYAGGNFSGSIRKWDGTSWTTVGSGFSGGEVLALAGLIDGTNRYLYASGKFTSIGGGGGTARHVARWNGSIWSALNAGLEFAVYGNGLGLLGEYGLALTVFDDGSGPAIHVGGEFCVSCPAFAESSNEDDRGATRSTDRLSRLRNSRRIKNQAAGSSFMGFVASWKPNEWSVLGNGLHLDTRDDEVLQPGVHALIVHDDGAGAALFAAGTFEPPRGPRPDNPAPFPLNGIAKFKGTIWSSLGTGLTNYNTDNPLPNPIPAPAEVYALAEFDEDGADANPPLLFAGGAFAYAGGVAVNNSARWDGASWSAVGNVGGIVRALAVFDDDGAGSNPEALYAGGDFASRIKRWNPLSGTWTALGSGIGNGSVYALAVFGNELYVGGTFTDAGGVAAADYLARWNGTSWSAVQSSVNGFVYALHVFDRDGAGSMAPELYVGGAFTTAGGTTVNRIARWDGSSWSVVGPVSDPGFGPAGTKITALFGFENSQGRFLYAGGDFTQSASASLILNRLAKWNPNPTINAWSAVGSNEFGNGVDGENTVIVHTLAAFDDGTTGLSLFAGGSFESAGGQFNQQTGACEPDTGCVPAANIAKLGCR